VRQQARHALDPEHGGIDGEDDPEDAGMAFPQRCNLASLVLAATSHPTILRAACGARWHDRHFKLTHYLIVGWFAAAPSAAHAGCG